jgi:uncharacterized protein YbjT (DUF2867 family)
MILVTGANGMTGKALVHLLSARGVAVRATVRTLPTAAGLSSLPNVAAAVSRRVASGA